MKSATLIWLAWKTSRKYEKYNFICLVLKTKRKYKKNTILFFLASKT